MNSHTFTYVIEEMMDNGVTGEDFELILNQLETLKFDEQEGMILSHQLEIASNEQSILSICAQRGILYKEHTNLITHINMTLVFNKEVLKRFLKEEVGIDEDEDDRGLELAIFDSSIMNIGDEIATIITKYE